MDNVGWFTDYDVLIVDGTVIESHSFSEKTKFRVQEVTDCKVEISNGEVMALAQTVTHEINLKNQLTS